MDEAVTYETELISVVTPLLDKREGRIENIRLTVETLQGKVLGPKEEFSFNESVGRRTMERGFKKAVVFKDNEKEKEVGGGICQVSSALYKAAKDAGLTVTERHEHGLLVDYVPKGEDATVYYGELDLKFLNSTDKPIRMDFYLGSDELTVTLTSLGA
ncbi:MAG: VanW family protein [Clostridia bacterium]|nr:VanW family protein [Clostridia bacterium]